MKTGKVPVNVLKRSVLRQMKTKRKEVQSGAGVGRDCAVFSFSDDCVVSCMQEAAVTADSAETSTDRGYPKLPVRFTMSQLIQKCANNLAASGAEPVAAMITLLLPEAMEESELKALMAEAEEKCRELSMDIVGGQTRIMGEVFAPLAVVAGFGRISSDTTSDITSGIASGITQDVTPDIALGIASSITQGVTSDIASGITSGITPCMMRNISSDRGSARHTVRGAAARSATLGSTALRGVAPGQDVVLSKWIGLEGTAYLAEQCREKLLARYPAYLVEEAVGFHRFLSVLPEAAAAVKSGVCAMHDASEGGIFAALWELAEGAGIGMTIDMKKLPIRQETVEVCECCNVNPYQLLSGGCLIMTTEDGPGLVESLKAQGIPAAVVGKVTDSKDRLLLNEGEVRYMDRPGSDELYRFLSELR